MKKKTIVSTSIKSVGSVEVKESFEEVETALGEKGSFIKLQRLSTVSGESRILIRKTVVKIVKEHIL